MKHVLPLLLSLVAASNALAGQVHIPTREIAPDAQSAIAIARAKLIPIYGAGTIEGEEPLVATRQGDLWVVHGTLRCGLSWFERIVGGLCLGGTAEVKLLAKDGRVLHVTHYK